MSHHYIKFSNVSYRYPDGTEALKDVSFTITHGERVALLGLNGSGKSTLLLHTNGLLLPSQGTVDIGGIPVEKKTLGNIRRSVGMVFQNPDDMLFMPTIYEDVAFGPRNMGLSEEAVSIKVEQALRAVGQPEIGSRCATELSGGQRRSAAIASVLSMEPDILVLDEPSANLDGKARRNLFEILSYFSHTILLATHDLSLAAAVCDRAILLDNGKIETDGTVEDVLNHPIVKEWVIRR